MLAVKVEVKFLATIRVITGESSIELLCNHHDTAGTVMQMLVEKYSKKFEQVIMGKTNQKSSIKYYIFNENLVKQNRSGKDLHTRRQLHRIHDRI